MNRKPVRLLAVFALILFTFTLFPFTCADAAGFIFLFRAKHTSERTDFNRSVNSSKKMENVIFNPSNEVTLRETGIDYTKPVLSAGHEFIVGVTVDNKIVKVQTGDHNKTYGADDIPPDLPQDWNNYNFEAVYAGYNDVAALTTDGKVYAYGKDDYYEEYMYGKTKRYYENFIPPFWNNDLKFQSVAVGEHHKVGLTTDGVVYSTGIDYDTLSSVDWKVYSPLGRPQGNWRDTVGNWKNIVAVAAGKRCTVGLDENGKMHVAGQLLGGHYLDWRDWYLPVDWNVYHYTAIAACDNYIAGVAERDDGTKVRVVDGDMNVTEYEWDDIMAVSAGNYAPYLIGLRRNKDVAWNCDDRFDPDGPTPCPVFTCTSPECSPHNNKIPSDTGLDDWSHIDWLTTGYGLSAAITDPTYTGYQKKYVIKNSVRDHFHLDYSPINSWNIKKPSYFDRKDGTYENAIDTGNVNSVVKSIYWVAEIPDYCALSVKDAVYLKIKNNSGEYDSFKCDPVKVGSSSVYKFKQTVGNGQYIKGRFTNYQVCLHSEYPLYVRPVLKEVAVEYIVDR